MDETQAEIKISGRNINNPIYTDDTTLMAQSKEELKSLLMNVNEESEKLASGSITSWQIDRETVLDFILGGSKNHCRWWLQQQN